MHVIVTGGAGFIGSALVRYLIAETEATVTVIDKLTYAANLSSLASVKDSPRFRLVQEDICHGAAMQALFQDARPDCVMHLAAESHVDRSIATKRPLTIRLHPIQLRKPHPIISSAPGTEPMTYRCSSRTVRTIMGLIIFLRSLSRWSH